MPVEPPSAEWLAEIDAVHREVREAFRRKDLSAYMDRIAPDLDFRRPNGARLQRAELARDVAKQFERLVAFDSQFDREFASVAGNDLIETGTQRAWIALRVFFIFAITWEVERHGAYTWTRATAGWRLREVRLDREKISRAGFGLA